MPAIADYRAHPPASPDPTAEAVLTMLAVVLVCLLAAGYGRGVQDLWSRRGTGRVVPVWRVGAFTAGALVVLVADQGPVRELAEDSFAGHMAQHMLLMLGAAPLLAAGAAGLPLTLAAPIPMRRRLARWRVAPAFRWFRQPVRYALLVGGGQTLALWFWHLPGPYVAAVDGPGAHAAEHLCFVVAGWLLWAPVCGPARHRLPPPVTVLLFLATMLPATALGAALTFAPVPVYPSRILGADPLADQQLAGLLMWAPMDVAGLAVALSLFLRWLARLERVRPGGLRPADAQPTRTAATGVGLDGTTR